MWLFVPGYFHDFEFGIEVGKGDSFALAKLLRRVRDAGVVRAEYGHLPAFEQRPIAADMIRMMVRVENRDEHEAFAIQVVDDRFRIARIDHRCARSVPHRPDVVIVEGANRNDLKGAHRSPQYVDVIQARART